MSRREERAIRCEVQDLVAEAEAMLNGRAITRPWCHHKQLGWMSVNTLAHADWPTLSAIADRGLLSRDREWNAALMFLAAELLAAAGSRVGLAAAQRAQLIPLEVDLLAGTATAPSTPSNLVTIVLPYIDRAAPRRRHPDTGKPPRRRDG
jgi:hypothetical protein